MENNVTEEEKEAEQTTRFSTNWLAGGFNMAGTGLFWVSGPKHLKLC